MMNTEDIKSDVEKALMLESRLSDTLAVINNVITTNEANRRNRDKMIKTVEELVEVNKQNSEAVDIATHAIEILQGVSNDAVKGAYKFIEDNLNSTLERMFNNTVRKINIVEFTSRGQYPQLTLELDVGNGVKRTLKNDSGHGLAQIVSILCILCIIVITGSRRIVLMDEVLSGISAKNRMVIEEVLWTFTGIGFQFIVNEHGFVPKGSQVYYVKMENDVGKIAGEFIAEHGTYLQADSTDGLDYMKLADSKVNDNSDIDEVDDINDISTSDIGVVTL